MLDIPAGPAGTTRVPGEAHADGARISDYFSPSREQRDDVRRRQAVADRLRQPARAFGSPSLDGVQTRTRTRTVQTRTDDTAMIETAGPGLDAGPGPDARSGSGPVSLGYRLETRTDGVWSEARTGHTPPIFRSTQTDLDATADTVLSNARQMLGLGPKDLLPPVRVQTWHHHSGLTGSASHAA
jgi:hypothetical protein